MLNKFTSYIILYGYSVKKNIEKLWMSHTPH